MRRFIAIALMVLTMLVVALSLPVVAKGQGPIRLMDSKGHVSTVKGDRASRWWNYFASRRCESCNSPKQAAVLLAAASRGGHRDGGAPVYLFRPRYLDVSWPRAWILLASTRRMPAYLVVRGGVADEGKRWDSWTRVTEKMERIILGGNRDGQEGIGPVRIESQGPQQGPQQLVDLVPMLLLVGMGGLLAVLRKARSRTANNIGASRTAP